MVSTPPTNLTPGGRRRRAVSGLVGIAAGVAFTAWLHPRAVVWPAGLLTFPLFLLGTIGIIQALTGT